jgi:ABC-2 type transport system permease protein
MKTIWYIARKDLLETFKDRGSLVLLLLVPLVLITAVGLTLGGLFDSGTNQINVNVAVNNQDNGYVGKTVIDALKINTSQLKVTVEQYNSADQVKNIVANGKDAHGNTVNAGVVIPAGTTNKLIAASRNGTPTHNLVQFYALPSNNDPTVTIAQNIVTNVVNQLASSQFAGTSAVEQVYNVCNRPGNHCSQSSINAASIASTVGNASASAASAAQMQALTAGKVQGKINSFNFIVPGYAILFALFGIQAAAATILDEKEQGTFRRLLIAPIQKYALLGGKLLAQFLMTLAQLAVLFAIGYFAFHLNIGSWPGVILLLIGTSFATTGLGILLVAIVKTRRQLNPIVTLISLVMSAIGGAWWPLSIEPQWMQQFAKIGITAWAMEGLNGIMLYGKAFSDVLPDLLGLLGYGLICFLIGMRLFRFQEKAA